MRDNISEKFFKNSILNLFSFLQHPIPGSFFVHWAKEESLQGKGLFSAIENLD